MLNKLKTKIKELAKIAVVIAEETLGSNKGKQKKKMAVEYITNKLPIPTPFKSIVIFMLSSFIDETVDFAVECMNTQK
jgi:hypothetical protein